MASEPATELPAWLQISEIALRWSREREESAPAIEQELIEWFSEYLIRFSPLELQKASGNPDAPLINADRHMKRDILEVFCREQGLAKPAFWFPPQTAKVGGNPVARVGRWWRCEMLL